MTLPTARYQALVQSGNPAERQLARRQLSRLQRPTPAPATRAGASQWAHVPLDVLLQEAGNVVRRRRNGRLESGHEPVHRSTSDRCVVVDPSLGLWWCRSCRRGGDAANLLMKLHGWPYRRAATVLAERFGQPGGRRG